MNINIIMNSISDAHSNKRIKDFENQGFNINIFGFNRGIGSPRRDDISIVGNFTNTTQYYKRILTYINGIRKAFKLAGDKECIWFYQGLDTALFSIVFGKKCKYIYEECDLVHTNIKNRFLRNILERIDKYIIKKSYKTIVTSEGFLQYHYKDTKSIPQKIVLLPNKLSKEVRNYPFKERRAFNPNNIRFAFVGGVRYNSLLSLAKHICRNFPNHEFHFYGYVSQTINESELPKGKNIYYHGSFNGPLDLPKIYSEVDVVVATYDISSTNVKFAEPNKLYESIYFNCPIVVSKLTFLENKVKKLKIGYSVDVYNEDDVKKLVKDIESSYINIKESISKIPQDTAIDNYNIKDLFYDK